jgi:hypothetical protein
MVFPYLEALYNNKRGFFYLFIGSVVVFLYLYHWTLTSGIKGLSLAGIVGVFFFCIFFEEEKEGCYTLEKSSSFFVQFVKIGCIFEFLLDKKKTIKKKIYSNQSLGSEDIIILKCVIFQHFLWTTTQLF